jgi:hypothetical protein
MIILRKIAPSRDCPLQVGLILKIAIGLDESVAQLSATDAVARLKKQFRERSNAILP